MALFYELSSTPFLKIMKVVNKLYPLFNFLCFLGTVVLVSRCVYQYILDYDVTQVEYPRFHEIDGSIHPSTTFCFQKPLKFVRSNGWCTNTEPNAITDKIRKFCKRTKYRDAQLRMEFNHSYYDEMSLNLEEYLARITVKLQNNGFLKYKFRNGALQLMRAYSAAIREEKQTDFSEQQKSTIKDARLYISHRGAEEKCYSFDPPFIVNNRIKQITFVINGKLLGHRILPQKRQYSVSFHYPNQKMKSLSTEDGWESKYYNASNYARKYYLANIEVLRRRKKQTTLCVDGHYDAQRVHDAIKATGCKPSIIVMGNETRNCEKLEEYYRFEEQLDSYDHAPPCTELQSMNEWHGEKLLNDKDTKKLREANEILRKAISILTIEIHFTDDIFKEFIYLKAYSIESLIGNSGGYIGMSFSTF